MKKNKILAGLSALVMGATMMASTAMSASAATILNSDGTLNTAATYSDANCTQPITGGGFQAKMGNNWVNAPHGMFDFNIAGIGSYAHAVQFTDSTNTSVAMDLQVADFVIGGNTFTGYISSIKNSDDEEQIENLPTIPSTATAGTSAGNCTLEVDEEYTIVIVIISGGQHMNYTIRFHKL